MKKQPAGNTKRFLNKLFDVRSWADWDRTKTISGYFLQQFKIFFIPKRDDDTTASSFETEVAKQNLSENDLIVRQKSLMRLVYIMLGMAFLFFVYALYQLMYGSILGVILSWILMLISIVLAFRYHFWYFQIKQRKLGCTLSEWFQKNFMGENK